MIRDAKGKQSKTLAFVTVAFTVLVLKFLIAGVAVTVPGVEPEVMFKTASMGAGEFGAAVLLILGIWLGREWREAHYDPDRPKG